MVSAVLLSNDIRLVTQVRTWVRNDLSGSIYLHDFRSLEEFKADIEKPAEESPSDGANVGEKNYRLIIIDTDIISQKPVQWVADLKRYLGENGRSDAAKPVKVLLMGYETGTHKPSALQNEAVDDLILKPIDYTLFKQKLEILTADTDSTASFLYKQKTKQTIEVGKEIVIDEISEYAICVRNPRPLAEGVFAAVHSDVFGEGASSRVLARAYSNSKHPVIEGEYLVKFSFFGITSEQLSSVRRYVRSQQTPVRMKVAWGVPEKQIRAGSFSKSAPGAEMSGTSSSSSFVRPRKFAVIDMDPGILTEMKDILETGLKGVVMRPFPSYLRLLAELRKLSPETPALSVTAPLEPEIVEEATDALPKKGKVSFIVASTTHELLALEGIEQDDLVLGLTQTEWLERGERWLNVIEKEDRESFVDFLTAIESGSRGMTVVRMRDSAGRIAHFQASGSPGKSGANEGPSNLHLDFDLIDAAAWKETSSNDHAAGQAARDHSQYKFDGVFIEASLIRGEPVAWYEGFVDALVKAKVLGPSDAPPKVFIIANSRHMARVADQFRIKGVNDYILKPLDRRFILQKLQGLIPELHLTRELEAPPFVPCEIHAKIGKEVTMDELSEFSLTVLQKNPFRPSIFMHFFSPHFGEHGGWVTGRCLRCQKNSDTGVYRCQFMFFGPDEELLKSIRTFIREDYVAKKEGA